VKKCCLAQWNGIRKRKCSVIREDASKFWASKGWDRYTNNKNSHQNPFLLPFFTIGLTFWSSTLAFTVPLRAARNQWRSSFSIEPSERRFNMLIVPNKGFALSRKPHSFRLRKSHVLFPINKEIHFFFEIPSSSSTSPYHKTKRISSCRRLRADLSNGMAGCRMWSILVSHRFLSSPSIFFTTTAPTHKSKKHCGIVAFR
jgi:hypothetical protein